MTKMTVASAHARIDVLDAKIDQILALVSGRQIESAPIREVSAPIVTGEVLTVTDDKGTPFAVLRNKLREHKAAGKIPAGVTVKDAIAQGLMDANGNLPGESVTLTKAERKAAKKARKAQEAAQAVAVIVPSEPAKAKPLTPAQEARIDAPRRADGTMTPRSEWALREALAMTGKYDRYEVDALVEQARSNPDMAVLFN